MNHPGKRLLALVISVLVGLAVFLVPSAQAAGTGTISGTVTVVDGGPAMKLETQAQVQVLDGGTWKVVENHYTRYTYTSAPLAPGTYRVEFSNMDYVTQVSAPVTVTNGAATVIDAALDPGANIQGNFTVPAGGPAVDGSVRVYEQHSSGSWVQVDHGLVDPNGTYYVGGLGGGNYKVGFSDFKGNYAPEFFDEVATLEQAKLLSVPAGTSTTGIDVMLAAATAPVATAVTLSRAPRMVGIAQVGHRLRAVIGTTTPTSATVRYQWLLDGRRIKTATKRSLWLKAPMLRHRIAVRVIATAPGLDRYAGNSGSKLVRPAG